MTTSTIYVILKQPSELRKRCGMCFVYTFCLSIVGFNFLFQPCNCKHGLKYRQSWANHSFTIDGLENLDTISLIDVYERLIYAAIQ